MLNKLATPLEILPRGKLTTQCLQPIVYLLDVVILDITYISHKVCNLRKISIRTKIKFSCTRNPYIASAVANLFVNVVGTEYLIDYSNVSIILRY